MKSVRERGIKPTARLFATSTLSVSKWWRRYQQHGPSGLQEPSRAPHRHPLKTAGRSSAPQVAHLRSGAARLWREHGLLKSRKKKYQRNRDLAHIKARWALFQQVSADTKDLDDIPYYWPQFAAACCSDPSPKNTALRPVPFSLRVFNSIWIATGFSLHDLVWQTDNGGEFKGQFSTALGDSQHMRIPPTAHTKAMWRLCLASKKMNFSIWKTSLAMAISSPKSTPISCTSISRALTSTKKI